MVEHFGALRLDLAAANPHATCQLQASHRLSLSRLFGDRSSALRRKAETVVASMSLSLPLSDAGESHTPKADSVSNDAVPNTRNASNDPSTSGEDITALHSPEELAQLLSGNPGKLVVLMCKAIGCRPCKVFARKYQRVASTYKDCIFLEVTGDETTNLRKLMIQMGVRATPTFRLYREGECVKVHVGIDEGRLRDAVKQCLKENEAGYEPPEEPAEASHAF